jgi:hypothetical protein
LYSQNGLAQLRKHGYANEKEGVAWIIITRINTIFLASLMLL